LLVLSLLTAIVTGLVAAVPASAVVPAPPAEDPFYQPPAGF
jgi:hypothetical protein